MNILIILILCLRLSTLQTEEAHSSEVGRILFLLQQGQDTKALEQYQHYYQAIQKHDFELLHRIGLGIVEKGFQQNDPESQLLALFGASVSANEETYHILEESLKSPYPQIQLVAIQSLALYANDRSDRALVKALGSDEPLIRYEAAKILCAKKHPHAITQTESLMYKFPKEAHSVFPPLYAMAGNEKGIKILRRLLNDPSELVRNAAILSTAEYGRDDLLPQIRQLATHISYSQQETCAYALGVLKDTQSVEKLKLLSRSQYPHVALSAHRALYALGHHESVLPITEAAQNEDVFAIMALGDIENSSSTLIPLLKKEDLQTRLNAALALLEQKDPRAFPLLKYLLIQNKYDIALTPIFTPGHTFKAWKGIPSASQVLKDDIAAYAENIQMREEILTQAKKISEPHFLDLADSILSTQQNDLVPVLVNLLEELATPKAIELLKKYHQKVGAPLVRNYCNLALYKLREPGPYGDLLMQWVKNQNKEDLIRFRPFVPWGFKTTSYEFTPEEKSRLLIGAFEAFAVNQDEQGIQALLTAIKEGNQKNKYALAGLLIRATQ